VVTAARTLSLTLALLCACGDAATGTPANGDAGDATVAADAFSEASSDAGSDATTARDAAAGTLTCGRSTCVPPGEVCCTEIDGGTCMPAGDGAAPCGARHDFEIACLQPTDCPSGQVCCFEFHHGCNFNAFCYPSCDDALAQGHDGYRACETNPECGDAGPCAPHSCQNGGAPIAVKTCTPPQSGCCS
jgi:hypothetical protein